MSTGPKSIDDLCGLLNSPHVTTEKAGEILSSDTLKKLIVDPSGNDMMLKCARLPEEQARVFVDRFMCSTSGYETDIGIIDILRSPHLTDEEKETILEKFKNTCLSNPSLIAKVLLIPDLAEDRATEYFEKFIYLMARDNFRNSDALRTILLSPYMTHARILAVIAAAKNARCIGEIYSDAIAIIVTSPCMSNDDIDKLFTDYPYLIEKIKEPIGLREVIRQLTHAATRGTDEQKELAKNKIKHLITRDGWNLRENLLPYALHNLAKLGFNFERDLGLSEVDILTLIYKFMTPRINWIVTLSITNLNKLLQPISEETLSPNDMLLFRYCALNDPGLTAKMLENESASITESADAAKIEAKVEEGEEYDEAREAIDFTDIRRYLLRNFGQGHSISIGSSVTCSASAAGAGGEAATSAPSFFSSSITTPTATATTVAAAPSTLKP